MSADYVRRLPEAALVRYMKKLDLCGLKACPYALPAGAWASDPSVWPNLDFPKLYLYLINTPGVHTMQAMTNYKSLSSYKLLQAGWVQTVYCHQPENACCVVLKADVTPSFNVNKEAHHPWAAVGADGTIMTAHCDCKAGLGESCSHVGGLLYKVEMVVRLGGSSKACTDDLCKWNHAEWKGVPPAPLSEIKIYNTAAKDKITAAAARSRRADPNPMTQEEKQMFLRRMVLSKKLPVGLSLFRETAENFIPKKEMPPKKQLPHQPRKLFQTSVNFDEAIEILGTSDTQRTYLEESTKAQSSTLVWHEHRAGRITASIVHSVLHTNPKVPAPSLLKSMCSDQPSTVKSEAMNWGKTNEDEARANYADILKKQHTDFVVSKAGLCIHPQQPFIAASPDGFVSCSCCELGLVEIKCPYKFRGETILSMLTSKESYLDEDMKLPTNHKYFSQIQHQMYVTNRMFCDFVVWLSSKEMSITRVKYDPLYKTNTVPKLVNFWRLHVLPELQSRTLQCKSKSKPEKSTHCSCGQSDDVEEMVGCDNVNCPNEWYHWGCVGLKSKPRTKYWYCSLCKPHQGIQVQK